VSAFDLVQDGGSGLEVHDIVQNGRTKSFQAELDQGGGSRTFTAISKEHVTSLFDLVLPALEETAESIGVKP
jgi:hypothetical protein